MTVIKVQEQNKRTSKVIIPVRVARKMKLKKGMELKVYNTDDAVTFAKRYYCEQCMCYHVSGSKIFKKHA